MNDKEKAEAAREKLLSVLPYLRDAMAEAKREGEPEIGILAVKSGRKDGRVVCRFRADEFVDDLCDALGAPRENTEDERLDVAATRIVQMVENSGGKIECTSLLASADTEKGGE